MKGEGTFRVLIPFAWDVKTFCFLSVNMQGFLRKINFADGDDRNSRVHKSHLLSRVQLIQIDVVDEAFIVRYSGLLSS